VAKTLDSSQKTIFSEALVHVQRTAMLLLMYALVPLAAQNLKAL
jgi:hypothetical protein